MAHSAYLNIILVLVICTGSKDLTKNEDVHIDINSTVNCSFKGHRLYGRIQYVNSFPDIKVQVVNSFPDLKVKIVNSHANRCGEWRIVDSHPDLKVQIVNSFPDLKIQFVQSFPGLTRNYRPKTD
jgi:hypothetical protein